MSTRRQTEEQRLPRRVVPTPPATTPKQREDQLISLAYNEAEKRIRSGQATSTEIVHFLKLGSSREQLEQERIAMGNELDRVKMEALQAQQRTEQMFAEALSAMRTYQGVEADDSLELEEHDYDY